MSICIIHGGKKGFFFISYFITYTVGLLNGKAQPQSQQHFVASIFFVARNSTFCKKKKSSNPLQGSP
jgi:hypothetical protein